MEFNLTKNPKAPRGQYLLDVPSGVTIAYEEPLKNDLFPALKRALSQTNWPMQFNGLYYRLRSNGGFLEECVPAPEYYKLSMRAMSQKYHSFLCNGRNLETLIRHIQEVYQNNLDRFGRSGQPKIRFNMELYELRTELSSFLFHIKALLDQFAALVQFLSGPRANKFASFNDLVKKARKANPPPEIDKKLAVYLAREIGWFSRMRDLRDFIAHHGFIRLQLIETSGGRLELFFHHRIELISLIDECTLGLDDTLNFLDTHFAHKIRNPQQMVGD